MSSRPRPAAFAAAAAIALSIAASAYAAYRVESASIEAAKGYIEARLRPYVEGFGLSLRYGSLSPSILRGAAVREIELLSGGRSVLRLRELRVRYELFDMLRGRELEFRGRAEGLELSIDAELDRELFNRLQRSFAASSEGEPGGGESDIAPARLPSIDLELRDVTVRLRGEGLPEASLTLRRLDALLRPDASLALSASGFIAARDDAARFMATRLELPFALSASAAADFSQAELSFAFSGDSDLGRLSELRLAARYDGRQILAELARPSFGLERLSASYDIEGGVATLDASMTSFVPTRVFRPSAVAPELAAWLSVAYSGSLAVRSDLSLEGSEVALDLRATLPIELPGGRARARLAARGGLAELRVSAASLTNADLDLGFAGSVRPLDLAASGALSTRYRARGEAFASARWELSGQGDSWFAYAPALSLGAGADLEPVLQDLVVSAELAGGALALYVDAALPDGSERSAGPAASVSAGGDAGDPAAAFEPFGSVALPRIRAEARIEGGDEAFVEAALSLDPAYLGAVASRTRGLGLESAFGVLRGLRVGGELNLFVAEGALSYSSSSILLTHDAFSPAYALVSLAGNAERLEIKRLEASVAGYDITGDARLSLGGSGGRTFDAGLSVQGIPYELRGAIDDAFVSLRGSYGLRATFSPSPQGLSLTIGIDELPLPLPGGLATLSLEARANVESASSWRANIDRARLGPVSPEASRYPFIEVRGSIEPGEADFPYFGVSDRYSELAGAASIRWGADAGRLAVELAGPAGEAYQLEAGLTPDGLAGRAVVRSSPLARLQVQALAGSFADAELELGGLLGDPSVGGKLTLNPGRASASRPSGAISARYASSVIEVSDASLGYAGQSLEGLSGRFDLASLSGELAGRFTLGPGAYPFLGRAELRTEPDGEGGFALSGALRNLSADGVSLPDWPLAARLRGESFSLAAGPSDEIVVRREAGNLVDIALAPSLPLSFHARGVIEAARISMRAERVTLDVPFLFTLLDLGVVGASSGKARGELVIQGALGDPELEGAFEFENTYLVVPDFVPEPIGPFTAPLYFTGRGMETNQTGLDCAGALINASLRSVIRNWVPAELSILASSSQGLVPIETKLLGMEIQGGARPELAIDVRDQSVRIGGTISIEEGDIVLTTGLIAQEEGGEDSFGFAIDLGLRFGRSVRLYFPDRRLPLLYGQADPSSRLQATFNGASGGFSLRGAARLRGGSVFYVQRNFYLKNATIQFNESEISFDPLLTVEAETRSRNAAGPVLILLKAENSRLSELSFRMEALPSLSEQEILALLGRELLAADESGRPDFARAVVENSELIPQLNFLSAFERRAQQLLGLDLLFTRTLLLQRWLYDLSGLSGGAETLTLADYLDNTSITAGKYFGESLYAQLELRLREEGLANERSLGLDSELSLEWQTPHFLFNWSFKPEHPEALFVTDHRFSVFWRIPLK